MSNLNWTMGILLFVIFCPVTVWYWWTRSPIATLVFVGTSTPLIIIHLFATRELSPMSRLPVLIVILICILTSFLNFARISQKLLIASINASIFMLVVLYIGLKEFSSEYLLLQSITSVFSKPTAKGIFVHIKRFYQYGMRTIQITDYPEVNQLFTDLTIPLGSLVDTESAIKSILIYGKNETREKFESEKTDLNPLFAMSLKEVWTRYSNDTDFQNNSARLIIDIVYTKWDT